MKTTKKHFVLFVKEAQKWIDFWGLTDWRVDFFHEDWTESYGEAQAWCRWNIVGRIASLCLNTDLQYDFTQRDLRESAFHEVAHIILSRLQTLAGSRYLESEEVSEEVEAIIRRMENCVFK